MENYGNLTLGPLISYQPKKSDMVLQFHTWIKTGTIINLANDFCKGWMVKNICADVTIDNKLLQTNKKKINSLTEKQVNNTNQAIYKVSADKYEKRVFTAYLSLPPLSSPVPGKEI